MKRKVICLDSPDSLNPHWDKLAQCYFQKREFLSLLHTYNFCSQRYYELYMDGRLTAGATVFTHGMNLLTFSKASLTIKMRVIAISASIATSPLIGNENEFENLCKEIVSRENGWVVALNLPVGFNLHGVVNMRTLPTLILKNPFLSMEHYSQSLRHPYRRRLKSIQSKFEEVRSIASDCASFTPDHYGLYLQIMKRTKTKVETLPFDLFRNLPRGFTLTTHYYERTMLSWHICYADNDTLYFFFGGTDYSKREEYQSYHNNLLSILREAIDNGHASVDFGQTAERAKANLGAEYSERQMFIYHKNRFIRGGLKLFKGLITYNKIPHNANVFNNITKAKHLNETKLLELDTLILNP